MLSLDRGMRVLRDVPTSIAPSCQIESRTVVSNVTRNNTILRDCEVSMQQFPTESGDAHGARKIEVFLGLEQVYSVRRTRSSSLRIEPGSATQDVGVVGYHDLICRIPLGVCGPWARRRDMAQCYRHLQYEG